MGQVFTSYSRRDVETVGRIVNELEHSGFDVWIDREDIQAGNNWRVQIVEAIDNCHAFMLMLSPNSAISDNVRKEIDLAQETGRKTFVIMLEPVKPPAAIRYQLVGLQFIDLQALGFEKAISQLTGVLQEHLKTVLAKDTSNRQVELVIQGIDISAFDEEKKQQLLDFLAQMSNADRSQLKIEKVTAGSVHVFVDLPAKAAYQLTTQALNRDPRFRQFGIVSLKLQGSARYIHTRTGQFTERATHGPLESFLGSLPGKLTLALLVLLLIGAALASFFGKANTPIPALTPTPSLSAIETATPTQPPAATSTQAASTVTPMPLSAPIVTETLTPVPEYKTFTGEVQADQLACRYGPGAKYLYEYGLIRTNEVEILGKADTAYGVWLYVQFGTELRPCWVNAEFIDLRGGDPATLEPVYPQKAPLIQFYHPNFAAPRDVRAERSGNQVKITWIGMQLALGDRESANSPLYMVEVWTCQAGQIVFTPLAAFAEYAIVPDEPGCSTPSHGRVYLAHKDGYVGPSEIPWPP